MHNFNAKKQQGLTLIELLVSMALGVIVLLGTTQSLMSLSRSSRLQMEKNTMAQTADIALSYLTQHLRGATASPCKSIRKINLDNGLAVHSLTNDNVDDTESNTMKDLLLGQGIKIEQQTGLNLAGFEGATHTDNVIFMSTKSPVLITDETGMENPSVTVKGYDIYDQYTSTKTDASGNETVTLNNKLFVVTNCEKMDVFSAETFTKDDDKPYTVITPKTDTIFSSNYRGADSAFLAELVAESVYIKTVGERRQLFNQPFYDQSNTNNLLDDIALMRVLFGIDTDSDGMVNKYITAKQLENLSSTQDLITMEIYMLIASDKTYSGQEIDSDYSVRIPDTTQSIGDDGTIPMEELTITDRKLRRVFVRSVTLRNNAAL